MVGEELPCKHEVHNPWHNPHNTFAVVVTKDHVVFGHLPRKFSAIFWSFLQSGLVECILNFKHHIFLNKKFRGSWSSAKITKLQIFYIYDIKKHIYIDSICILLTQYYQVVYNQICYRENHCHALGGSDGRYTPYAKFTDT